MNGLREQVPEGQNTSGAPETRKPLLWQHSVGQGMREDVKLIFLPRQRIFDYQWGRQPGRENATAGNAMRTTVAAKQDVRLVLAAEVRRLDQTLASGHLQNRGNPDLIMASWLMCRRTLMLDADPP